MRQRFSLQIRLVGIYKPTVGDGGIDLILKKSGLVAFVQCKGLKSKVSVSAIRDAAGVKARFKPSSFMVVAPNGFSSGSVEFAKASKIRLMDKSSLTKLARQKLREIG